MNVNLSSTVPTAPLQGHPAPLAPKELPSVIFRSTEKALASQKEISATFSGMDRETLLTRDGMKFALGNSTVKAKVKDGVVQALHKISDKLAPDSVGSHRKEAVRLADQYHAAKAAGASPQEQVEILNHLKQELEAHKPSGTRGESVGKLVEFVELEMSILDNQQKTEAQDVTARQDTGERQVDVAMHHLKEHTGLATGQVNDEIRSFDRSQLRHVDVPKEGEGTPSSVPKWAKHEFGYSSLKSDNIKATPQGVVKQEAGMLQDPGLSALSDKFRGSTNFAHLLTSAINALNGGDAQTLKDTAVTMGRRLGRDINAQGNLSQMAFAISDGARFKDDLYTSLKAGNPLLPDDIANAPSEVKAFLDDVYSTILDQFPDRQTAPDKVTIRGKEYTKGAQLGEGGFGTVDLYEHSHEVTDPTTGEKRTVTEQIAIKTFKTGKLDDAATEIRAHQSAMGPTGHENIVGMKGVVRCPDGSVMMAMEVAKTDADQMIQKLDQAVANGTLSPLAANAIRLTVMKDMLQGLQHFQETRGMTHADVKDPNYLIGTDGRAKLADFGTATTGDARWYGEALVANPRWKAPEILAQDEQRRVDKSGIVTKKKAELEEAMNALDELGLPKAERTEAGKELKKGIDVTAKARVEALPDNVVTPKADTWSAGITAYRLFHGEYPFEADFNSEIEELITEYAKNPDGTLIEMGRDATGKPVTALDRVLNDMLQVDPAKRPSVTDVLRNPIFDEPFVGSEDAYALIKALSEENPDPAKLKALSDKLGD